MSGSCRGEFIQREKHGGTCSVRTEPWGRVCTAEATGGTTAPCGACPGVSCWSWCQILAVVWQMLVLVSDVGISVSDASHSVRYSTGTHSHGLLLSVHAHTNGHTFLKYALTQLICTHMVLFHSLTHTCLYSTYTHWHTSCALM